MKHLSILYLLLMLGLLLSCETEIPFNGTITEPVLVVNCVACTDSALQVNVSASRFFLSSEVDFPAISNATVALYVNGVFSENLTPIGQGNYQSTYIPSEGDVVRMNVSANGYNPIWTETAFPIAVAGFQIDSTITKTDTVPFQDGGFIGPGGISQPISDSTIMTYSYIHQYKIRFSNPAGEKNYFRLVVRQMDTKDGIYYGNSYLNDFSDIVFGTKNETASGFVNTSNRDRFNVFSDDLIDGATHTISFSYTQSFKLYADTTLLKDTNSDKDWSLTIDLQSISKSYYLYLLSLKALGSSDGFMSEPVQIYTNINGGLGIFGTRTIQPRKFILPK
jgi:hypothetical protein